MRFKTIIHSAAAIVIAGSMVACTPQPYHYFGPGCLAYLYSLPNLQGYGIPIVTDAPDLAAAWQNKVMSVKVVYGTWRLFDQADYKGPMGDYKAPADLAQLVPAGKLNSLRCLAPEPVPTPKYW